MACKIDTLLCESFSSSQGMLALIARKHSLVVSSVKLIVGLIHTQVNSVLQVYSLLTWHTFLDLSFSMAPLPTAALAS
jgi:hypothetical protein